MSKLFLCGALIYSIHSSFIHSANVYLTTYHKWNTIETILYSNQNRLASYLLEDKNLVMEDMMLHLGF